MILVGNLASLFIRHVAWVLIQSLSHVRADLKDPSELWLSSSDLPHIISVAAVGASGLAFTVRSGKAPKNKMPHLDLRNIKFRTKKWTMGPISLL
jgi:hypothetical protein